MAVRASALSWQFLFERAMTEEIGIAFRVDGIPRETFRQRLYECRTQTKDPRYDQLSLFSPAAPHDNEIWICKSAVELDAP